MKLALASILFSFIAVGCATHHPQDQIGQNQKSLLADRAVAQAITGDALQIHQWLEYCRQNDMRPKLNAILDPTRFINYLYYTEAYRMYVSYATDRQLDYFQRTRWNRALLDYYNQVRQP